MMGSFPSPGLLLRGGSRPIWTNAWVNCVALASDFDGATVPKEIGDSARLPRLVTALREAKYGDGDLDKICRQNWLRAFRSTWGS